MKVFVFGNCHVLSWEALLKTAGYRDLTVKRFDEATDADLAPDVIAAFDLILVHAGWKKRPDLVSALNDHPRLVTMPGLFFKGFTPDDEISVTYAGGRRPLLSAIAVGAFRNGLSREEANALYNPTFCEFMRYDAELASASTNLIRSMSPDVPEAAQLYAKWFARGPFFYTANHPKLFVVEDVLRTVLSSKAGITLPQGLSEYCQDPLQAFAHSPQMNHPDRLNPLDDPEHVRLNGGRLFTCREFVDECYDLLEKNKQTVVYNDASNARFDAALKRWRAHRSPEKATNPYRSQPSHAYWSRAVARPAPEDVSPIGKTQPLIGRETRVATAGSCFAQHVARAMVSDGLNYYVAERAPDGMEKETADAHGYGLFSARYGNIYCSRQLLQLIQRAYGAFTPLESAWPVDGGYVDPFRPNIGEVFASPEAVIEAREAHLAKVREMFESLDVFVFTMGLTEGWIDRRDGASFPVAPAAVTPHVNPEHFTFVNSDYEAIRDEMTAFLTLLGQVNPTAQIVLTVSPVPLIATYTETDVLSATTYSKSVLRAVAGDLATGSESVCYFPSYEIITGAFNRGAYFEQDLRSVRPEGVAHVMRVFRERLVSGAQEAVVTLEEVHEEPDQEFERLQDVVCDEEMLVR